MWRMRRWQIKAVDAARKTALHVAAGQGHAAICQACLRSLCHASTLTVRGRTARATSFVSLAALRAAASGVCGVMR